MSENEKKVETPPESHELSMEDMEKVSGGLFSQAVLGTSLLSGRSLLSGASLISGASLMSPPDIGLSKTISTNV